MATKERGTDSKTENVPAGSNQTESSNHNETSSRKEITDKGQLGDHPMRENPLGWKPGEPQLSEDQQDTINRIHEAMDQVAPESDVEKVRGGKVDTNSSEARDLLQTNTRQGAPGGNKGYDTDALARQAAAIKAVDEKQNEK